MHGATCTGTLCVCAVSNAKRALCVQLTDSKGITKRGTTLALKSKLHYHQKDGTLGDVVVDQTILKMSEGSQPAISAADGTACISLHHTAHHSRIIMRKNLKHDVWKPGKVRRSQRFGSNIDL